MTSPPPPADSAAPPGRRELNRARTHEAIVAALRELVEVTPAHEITVEAVAERAGVSRRTFFNYFGSIAALLGTVFAGHAASMVRQLDTEVFTEDPVAALRQLVAGHGIPVDFLGWLAVLGCHDTPTEAAVLLERAVWSDLAAWLEDQLHQLRPDADPLYISTLAAALMSCFKAAQAAWVSEMTLPDALTEAALTSFSDHLDRALGYLAHGWRPSA